MHAAWSLEGEVDENRSESSQAAESNRMIRLCTALTMLEKMERFTLHEVRVGIQLTQLRVPYAIQALLIRRSSAADPWQLDFSAEFWFHVFTFSTDALI